MPDLPLILRGVPDPMIVIGADGLITDMNPAARGLFGDWALGRDHGAVLRQPPVLAAIAAVLGGEGEGHADFTRTQRGRDVLYRVTITRLTEGAGLLHFADVTHIGEAEEMRRGFVANVSHELRSPLTALMGFIETLRGPARDDPEARMRFLDIMEEEAQRMNRLVSDLLSLARVEGTERQRPAHPVDLRGVLEGVAATLKGQAEAQGSKLEITGETGGPIPGDRDQLTQVFVNLTENALKYGGPNRPVTLALSEAAAGPGFRHPHLRVDVIDRGAGIEPAHLPRLTERFYRVDSHRSRAMGGTGLGLAIVKHILNRHQGKLTIRSRTGEGSVFSVFLPKGSAD